MARRSRRNGSHTINNPGDATSRRRSTDCPAPGPLRAGRTIDTEGCPQFGRSHDPHLCVSLKAPLKFVVARNQIPELHRLGFRYDTAIADTSVVRQKLLHALLYNRFGHARVMIQQLIPGRSILRVPKLTRWNIFRLSPDSRRDPQSAVAVHEKARHGDSLGGEAGAVVGGIVALDADRVNQVRSAHSSPRRRKSTWSES